MHEEGHLGQLGILCFIDKLCHILLPKQHLSEIFFRDFVRYLSPNIEQPSFWSSALQNS